MSDIQEPERYSDEIDRAGDLTRIVAEEGVKKVLHSIEKAPADFNGVNCIDCDNDIPEDRLKTGAFRCIYCQQAHEFRSKNHRSYYE